MVKVVEYENVYLEFPDEYELEDTSKEVEEIKLEEIEVEEEEQVIRESRTQRYSLEELQQKLEETQSLHL